MLLKIIQIYVIMYQRGGMRMPTTTLDNINFRERWRDSFVDYYEGYHKTGMTDFHMHDYYEFSLILSGNVKVLLPDHVQEGTESKIVLTAPKTPHFISRDPSVFYSRLNLLFSDEFIADYVPEWKQLQSVFGTCGKVITLTSEQSEFCKAQILDIEKETDSFRKRLKILCLLSSVSEIDGAHESHAETIPSYVTGALTYISEHYAEKIVAAELAWHLNLGRTTLMTGFKSYTGNTLNEYLIRYRVKNALRMLRQGATTQEAADACGFGDTCSLIRGFKKCYGMTPKQYLTEKKS